MSRPVLALLLLCCFTFLLGLGRQAITDSDEAYYAEAAREMVESGDWLTPHYNYQDRWEKPVLYYWVTAATYAVMGTAEEGARLWSALSGVGLAFLTWLAARRVYPDERAAWLAGAIVATAFGYVSMARQALPDLPLTFCITLGVWAALTATDQSGRGALSPAAVRRWAVAGLAAGLGFLLKGPVALVVPGVVLLPIWWLERRQSRPPLAGLAVAASVFAVVGLPWYVAMWRTHGSAYLQSFFVGDNLERFATSRYNDARSFWYYVPVVIGGLVPWSPYLALLRWRWPASHDQGTADLADVYNRRLLLWAVMPVVFYSLSIGKQPRYVLPVLPPLAILMARALSARIAQGHERRGRDRAMRWTTLGTAGLLLVAAVSLARAQPLFIHGSPVVLWGGVAATLVGAAALAWIAASGDWGRLPFALPVSAAVLSLTVQLGALSGRRPEPVEEIASLVLANRTEAEPVGQFGVFVRSLVFYAGFTQRPIYDEAQAVAFLESQERVLLVLDEAKLPAIEQAVGRSLPTIGRVRYLNAGNVRARTFLRPDPDEEITTVVVVTNR